MRAATTLAEAGLRPIVLDEASQAGGQIFRAPHPATDKEWAASQSRDAKRGETLRSAFLASERLIDFRPGSLVWNADRQYLHILRGGRTEALRWDALIIATGAMDRIIPLPGWTLPGVYTLGGAQTALKAQCCGIGENIVFFGTGPLLYLVAHQYAKSGIRVQAVLDTAPWDAKIKAATGLVRGGATFARGLLYMARLRARGIPIAFGVTPLSVEADQGGNAAAVSYKDGRGQERRVACDGVAFGYGLKSETQLADLLELSFAFDRRQRQWLPEEKGGRSSVPGIYLAGDGARVRGADVAELTGRRAALALLEDKGLQAPGERPASLTRAIDRHEPFRRALDERAFPFPVGLAQRIDDATIICRCEAVAAGSMRRAVFATGARELNRLKAFTRLGMGRCQGRLCGPAAAEILAASLGRPVEEVGRLRGQSPIKPVPLGLLGQAAS
jgi:NADPH-dependent 2,4-dienoyl-CoA reductase/sulfur reductase-like enzyme